MSGVELIIVFDKFEEWIARAPGVIGDANFELAEECADDMRRDVPVLTGELRDSIEANRLSDTESEARAGTDHCEYVEFGTRYMPAQPYNAPATERARSNGPDKFVRALEGLL